MLCQNGEEAKTIMSPVLYAPSLSALRLRRADGYVRVDMIENYHVKT